MLRFSFLYITNDKSDNKTHDRQKNNCSTGNYRGVIRNDKSEKNRKKRKNCAGYECSTETFGYLKSRKHRNDHECTHHEYANDAHTDRDGYCRERHQKHIDQVNR